MIISSEVGTHPLRRRRRLGRPLRPDPQRDLDRRHDDDRAPAGAKGLVAVDATSGAGGLMVDPTQFDCYYFAPQKSFSSDGGLWLALCSPAAIERIESLGRIGTLDAGVLRPQDRARQLSSQSDLQHSGPRHHSPARLSDQVDERRTAASSSPAGRSRTSAEILYTWAEASDFATPFVANPAERSNVVGTIDFRDDVDANVVAEVLRANGVVDTDPYRKLGRNQLRIAMFPSVDPRTWRRCAPASTGSWGISKVPKGRSPHSETLGRTTSSSSTTEMMLYLDPAWTAAAPCRPSAVRQSERSSARKSSGSSHA